MISEGAGRLHGVACGRQDSPELLMEVLTVVETDVEVDTEVDVSVVRIVVMVLEIPVVVVTRSTSEEVVEMVACEEV